MFKDAKVLNKAITAIKRGQFARVDLGDGKTIYKVPSANPKKYTIRLDIKVNEGEV